MGSAVTCPSCHQKINISIDIAGQTIACPMCKSQWHVAPPANTAPANTPNPTTQHVPDYQRPAESFYPNTRPDYAKPAYASKPEPGSNALFWIFGLLGGGCLFTLIAIVLSIVLLGQSVKKNLRQVQQKVAAANNDLASQNFLESRKEFDTVIRVQQRDNEPVPTPPNHLFQTIKYDTSLGPMSAYVSKPNNLGQKNPAIIWKFGGFGNGIGETAWEPQPAHDDQSASAFRKNGIVMMYPALRGGNDNPGVNETFFGEVDDILAAADYLAAQDYVDPQRIYLGGHSTGGTLVLLCAAASDRFRAVFSFGPVGDISGYGSEMLTFSTANKKELQLRNPIQWLHAIRNPTFVIEGTRGNQIPLRNLRAKNSNKNIHFHIINRKDHFSVLRPMNDLLARKVINDTGPTCNIKLTKTDLNSLK